MAEVFRKTAYSSGFLEPAPYSVLQLQVAALKALTREEKISLLTVSVLAALEVVNFDERWYLSAYPDVRAAIAKGEFSVGFDHFRSIGFFEGRFAAEPVVDEEFYISTYPDIGQAIGLGVLPSAKMHYLTKGYKEGRIPSANYMFGRPDSVLTLVGVKKRVLAELVSR